MKALTVRQPWASLIAAGVKTIDTRPRPTRYRGRIAIHAAKSKPEQGSIGGQYIVDWGLDPALTAAISGTPHMGDGCGFILLDDELNAIPLPLGAVVASAVLTDCVPIIGRDDGCHPPFIRNRDSRLLICTSSNGPLSSHVAAQAPFGDFSPGRWALLLDDIAPTTDRCPWCWGEGVTGSTVWEQTSREGGIWLDVVCPMCDGLTRCDPVPARGRGGLWEWTP